MTKLDVFLLKLERIAFTWGVWLLLVVGAILAVMIFEWLVGTLR